MPKILGMHGQMRVSAAVDRERIEPGRVYVAQPDLHLLVEPGYVRLTRGPRENRHRPAIDPLFRTAARAYGQRVLGIVLTGMLNDGALGLDVIKAEGGVAIVQDPSETMFDSMPLKAIKTADVDYVLKVAEMPEVISELVTGPWKEVEPARAKDILREFPRATGREEQAATIRDMLMSKQNPEVLSRLEPEHKTDELA